ncbi:uncharacterized protein LOC117175519 [Belonocnema kinseyi]|uniref:uncharacterized protein LOC117175519 n=1 Tax=Belonocnema kinseyi TaxID=2817044 RepID=UPI00143DA34A|nr:uncharacterized protein LOC117175519 [Belonocnema kinseyi]
MKMKTFYIIISCIIFNVGNINGDYTTGNFKEKTGLYFQDMGPISISREVYRIIMYHDLNHILNFNVYFDVSCSSESSKESASVCSTYLSIPEKVASQKNTSLRNLELDKDNFPFQETPISLYGHFEPADFNLYEGIHGPYYLSYVYPYNVKIYENKFGYKFPDKMEHISVHAAGYYNQLTTENFTEVNHLFHQWKSEVNTLEEAVILAKKGEIHSTILTPKILIKVLKDAKEKFKNSVVPFHLEDLNYNDIISVSNLKISITKNFLIYDLEVPMIEKDSYKLYRLVPWPMKLENQDTYFFVEPNEDYIAVKAYHHSYIPFKEDEIRNCKTSQERIFCSVPSTMIHLDLPNTCESALVSNHRDDFLSVCTVKLIKFRETIWQRLDNENSWIFTTSNDSIRIICSDDQSIQMTLNNSGWITLNSSCVATSNRVTLKPFQKHVENNAVPQATVFRLNVANRVEEYLKNLKIDLKEFDVFDFGRKAYLDLKDLRIRGTALDVMKKNTKTVCTHIWLWSFVVVLYFLFAMYILFDNFLKYQFSNKGSSRFSTEFSSKNLYPMEN